jgi:hypothetical protein
MYSTRYVHKISPSAKDVGPTVLLTDTSSKAKVAKALRAARILHAGGSIREMRHEGGKLVVFPSKSVWHSIILTKVG